MSTSPNVPDFFEEEDYSENIETMSPSNQDLVGDQREFDEEDDFAPGSGYEIGAVRTTQSVTNEEPSSSKRRKNPAAPKYGRSTLVDRDLLVMTFLRKFRFATSKQIGMLLATEKTRGKPSARANAHKRLLGLKEIGLVSYEKALGISQLWYLTQKGHDTLEFLRLFDDRVPPVHKPGRVVYSGLEHHMAIVQVAAQLVSGDHSVLGVSNPAIPAGIDLLVHLVPETYMRKAFSKAFHHPKSKFPAEGLARDKHKEVARAVEIGRIHPASVLAKLPQLWTLVVPFIREADGKKSHPADLVVDLEHLRTELHSPTSIALEIELHPKAAPEWQKILGSYKYEGTGSTFPIFARVVYVTPETKIADGVIKAAKKIELRKASVRPLLGADGVQSTGRVADL